MTRFAFTIEFDGTPYMGWQRQGHGPSVQQAIEEAIGRVTGEEAVLHAAGRTDAGVHALAMRAHVELAKEIEAESVRDNTTYLLDMLTAILASEKSPVILTKLLEKAKPG